MNKIKFYTQEELQTLRTEVLDRKRPSIIVREYSKKWGRPVHGLYLKVNQLRKEANLTKTSTKKVEEVKISKKLGRPRKDAVVNKPTATVENGVSLPSGFVFDFKPQRAEMHSDHVRLYF
jgi:hypothetical protein